jgi:hypothetical protein
VIAGADTATWIGAAAGAVGAVAAVLGLWAVFRRFRPEMTARIDGRRQGIRIDFENRGRAAGRVSRVAIVRGGSMTEVPAEFAGLPEERFRAAELPARSGDWYLIAAAPRTDGAFPEGVRVHARWGLGRRKTIEPEEAPDVGYAGMASQWPEK